MNEAEPRSANARVDLARFPELLVTDSAIEPIIFTYQFLLSDGRIWSFEVRLDPLTLKQLHSPRAIPPADRTRLEVSQCANCPLSTDTTPYCPVALSIDDMVDFFADSYAHEEARVIVQAKERSYEKVCSLQIGIGSLLGLLMATSGCPVMEPMRPLARSHLPFATAYETLPRVISRYLFQQYLKSRRGEEPDWEMSKLSQAYEAIGLVNEGISKRLSQVMVQDASRNAVSRLHVFAELLSFSIDENMIHEILDDFRCEGTVASDATD